MIAAVAALVLIATALLVNDHEPAVRSTESPSGRVPAAPATGGTPALAAPTPAVPSDTVDICGYGQVERSASEEIESKAQATAERTLGRVAVRLAASTNERESALGLFLPNWVRQGILDAYLQDHPECESQSCEQYATTLAEKKADAIEDTLVKSASGSRDPQVYALALQSCGKNFGGAFGHRDGGACTLLSVARWAELEPDNGVPWLLLAGAAQTVNDMAARDQAVYHASTAQRFDAHWPNFIGILQWPEIRAELPQTRWALADELFAMELVRPVLSYSPFLQFCNYPSVAEANRISVCGDLANLLLKQDHTLMGLGIGVKLAHSADWPSDVVGALRDEKDAVYKAAQKGMGAQKAGKVSTDCEDLARFEHWSADYAGLGQLEIARRLIDATGKQPARSATGTGLPRE